MSHSHEAPVALAFDDDRVAEIVIRIVSEEADTDPKEIARESLLLELLDSLGVTEVVMALEDEFELSVPDADIDRLRTVGDVIDYVRAELRKPRPVGTEPSR
jgi:acyl carrier protein